MEKTKKTDRRTLYTKKVIKDAYTELLKKKNYSQITVSEICRLAEINRSTFYLHYLDAYDVLDEISNDTVDSILSLSSASYDDFNDLSHGRKAYESIISDEKISFIMSKISTYPGYLDIFCKKQAERYVDALSKRSSLSREELIMVLESLLYSYQIMDINILKDHSVKELERYNDLFNEYVILPCLNKLNGN